MAEPKGIKALRRFYKRWHKITGVTARDLKDTFPWAKGKRITPKRRKK